MAWPRSKSLRFPYRRYHSDSRYIFIVAHSSRKLKIGGLLPRSAGNVAYISEKTPLNYDNVVRMSVLKILCRRNPLDVPRFFKQNISSLDVLSKISNHKFCLETSKNQILLERLLSLECIIVIIL